jgi:hypothetical protein
VFPVRYELVFYIPKDGILHSHRSETSLQKWIKSSSAKLNNLFANSLEIEISMSRSYVRHEAGV